MPELPEVETVVRDLRPRLVGRRITAVTAGVHSLRRPWAAAWDRLLPGRRIRTVRRRGKWIVLDLDRGLGLVLHLGMTGQLRVRTPAEPVEPHTHLVFALGDRRQLRFRDIRRFGSATLFTEPEAVEAFFRDAGLGPEPFDIDPAYWRDRLAGTARCLKAVLLDQRVLAGVGNIYADEALFESRLHPGRLGRDVSAAEADRLRRAVPAVLTRAIEKRGATLIDKAYAGGGYQREFRVYGRTGKPCPRCGTAVVRIRLAGRSTHFCPRCQPARPAAVPRPRSRAHVVSCV